MKKRVLILSAVALALAVLLGGCSGLGESDVPYADEMTENMLGGLNQNDSAMFSRDFSDTMKEALDETSFESTGEAIRTTIGTYESKSFYQAAETTQNDVDYIVVVYKARFTDEDEDVLVTVSFSGEQGSRKIEGLNFNSPKLRGE